MRTYLASFVVAALASSLITPLMRRVALRMNAVSPTGGRNVNTVEIPRLGGVGIALAAALPVALLFVVDSGVASFVRADALRFTGLCVGACLMCIVGAIDDTSGLRARTKLVVQVLCGILAYYSGFQINVISLPMFGALEMGAFAVPVTVIWIVGITNAVNLIDGLDGLAAGVVFCAAVTNLTVAIVTGSVVVAVVMASMMGALLGFLFYNFNPARIFMGDSGSYFLGYVLATMSLAGAAQKTSTTVSLLAPILALGVPIFDTLFSIVRRGITRQPIFSPDRGHLHHRLLDMGFTHKRAVLTLYGVSLVFAATAVAVALGRKWQIGAAIFVAAVTLAGLIRFVGYFELMRARRGLQRQGYDGLTKELLDWLSLCLSEARTIGGGTDESLAQMVSTSPFCEIVVLDEDSVVEFQDKKDLRSLLLPSNGSQGHRVCFRWESDLSISQEARVLMELFARLMLRRRCWASEED